MARRDDLRTLSYLLRDEPDLFQQFRSGAELEGMYASALTRKQQAKEKQRAEPVAEVFGALEECTRALDNLSLKMIREEELKSQLLQQVAELEKRIAFVKS